MLHWRWVKKVSALNDEGREFPFTAELRELLVAQKAKADALKEYGIICPWVFHRKGQPTMTFRRSWLMACENAVLPGRIPHDFRRTAVRNLVRAGIPERVAMTMTGHKTRSVFERCNIVSSGDLADAAELDNIRRLQIAERNNPTGLADSQWPSSCELGIACSRFGSANRHPVDAETGGYEA